MQAIEAANVAVLVLDAQQDIADQDDTIAGFALEAGRALVIAVNKWDGISEERRNDIKRDIARIYTVIRERELGLSVVPGAEA